MIVTYFKGVRWKVEAEMRQQTISTLEDARDAFRTRAEQLGAEKDGCMKKVGELEGVVATLKQLPRYDDVVRLFGEQMTHAEELAVARAQVAIKEVHALLEHQEQRSQERHDSQLTVLSAIEARLNKE